MNGHSSRKPISCCSIALGSTMPYALTCIEHSLGLLALLALKCAASKSVMLGTVALLDTQH